MAGSHVDTLVRVVRSDAEPRKKLVCKACFLSALAELAPEAVRWPGKERRWRRDELNALAAATVARIDAGADQLHCVVGVDEFSANLRYARGSLLYLRADTTPPLRVLMYASLPSPPPDPNLEALPRVGGADDEGAIQTAADRSIGAAKVVDAKGAAPEVVTAILTALAADPPAGAGDGDAPSDGHAAEKMRAERAAAWRGTNVREALTRAYGPFWHVVHDAHAFGAAVHETNGGGTRVVARRGKHDYLVWHHAAKRRGVVETVAKTIEWAAAFRALRYAFMVAVAAYALWYRAMCVDVEGFVVEHLDVAAEVAAAQAAAQAVGPTGVGAGFDDRAEALEAAARSAAARKAAKAARDAARGSQPSPLTALEPSLTRWGCEAGPKLAPIAVALLTVMCVSGTGVLNRIGYRMAAKAKKAM